MCGNFHIAQNVSIILEAHLFNITTNATVFKWKKHKFIVRYNGLRHSKL